MDYLVTTRLDRLPENHHIIMVDGTVPGWVPKPGDLHWDHHRSGGPEIQMDDIPLPDALAQSVDSILSTFPSDRPFCMTTTQVDADACCAAAWLQLPGNVLHGEVVDRLRSIAWDCDHLIVPEALNPWAEFAFKVGAALKVTSRSLVQLLGLPDDRRTWTTEQWEQFSSAAFEQGTTWLMAAALGKQSWPGEQGEADDFWETVHNDAQRLLADHRIRLLETAVGTFAVCNVRGIVRSIDPRAFYLAVSELADPPSLRPETLIQRDHKLGGRQYTIGCFPLHPGRASLDYTQGLFDRLTEAERVKFPQADGWGGRRIVGGSGWNTPSQLTPQEIIAIVCQWDALSSPT